MKRYLDHITQFDDEIGPLIDILKRENVTRFLEIGSRFGGSLWKIANELPIGSLVVSCDSSRGMGGKKEPAAESLAECISDLREKGYDAHLIRGDSQLPPQIEAVSAFAPFDAIFIDADHELKGVSKDWKNYGRMARIVAFHDIAWVKPEGYSNSKLVEVPLLWNDIKKKYRHEEFIHPGGNMGIGVLWRT